MRREQRLAVEQLKLDGWVAVLMQQGGSQISVMPDGDRVDATRKLGKQPVQEDCKR